jgi:hypothetical protein
LSVDIYRMRRLIMEIASSSRMPGLLAMTMRLLNLIPAQCLTMTVWLLSCSVSLSLKPFTSNVIAITRSGRSNLPIGSATLIYLAPLFKSKVSIWLTFSCRLLSWPLSDSIADCWSVIIFCCSFIPSSNTALSLS